MEHFHEIPFDDVQCYVIMCKWINLSTGLLAGKHDAKREPRVVFIVSTVNLVLQQKDRFELYLGDKYSVTEISGANQTETPLKYLLQGHKVVIMTAQILVNALNSNNKEQQVQLSDISLLIFDECHHAQKEHSYNQVMEKYKALKLQPGNQHKLPQVNKNTPLSSSHFVDEHGRDNEGCIVFDVFNHSHPAISIYSD